MKPARNTRRSPANWPPPKLAGSNFVARTTTPKRPIRIPATFSRLTVSPKKRIMRIAMKTIFTLTRRAVFDAVVRRMPSFWRSKPIALTAPRIHTIGSRKMRRSRRPIAARTSRPREAPRAIRAKVRKSGSTVSTVSLLPGKEVPQRTLARRIRATSRRREAIGRPEEAMGHMRFAGGSPRPSCRLYVPAGRFPRADGRGAASPRLRGHPHRGRDRWIRVPQDPPAAGRRDARGGHRARALPRTHPHPAEHDLEPEAPRGLWLRSGPRGGPHHGLDPDRRHRRPVADDVRGGPGVAVAAPAAVRPRRAPWHPGPRGPAHLCGKPRPPAGPSRDGRGLAEQRDHGRGLLRPADQLRLRRPRLAASRRRLLRREHRREHGVRPAGLPPHHAGRRRLHGRVLREHRIPDQPLDDPRRLLLSLAATGVAAAGKFVPGLLILPRAAGVRAEAVWPLAAFLIPRAEISLIIAQYGVTNGVTGDLLPIAMAVMIGTAVLPTPIGEWAKRPAAAEETAQTDPT